MWRKSGLLGTKLLILLVMTLTELLLSNFLIYPISKSSWSEVEAQPSVTTTPQDNTNELGNDAEDLAKKLREAKGPKIPNQFIVVLKNSQVLSSDSVRSLATDAKNQGASLRHIYDHAIHGFAIRVPNDKVLQSILKMPQVDYIEPDILVSAFDQILPTGINRVDGDMSSARSGDGRGAVNVDIGILDTGIDLNHPDLNIYKQISFVSGATNGNDDNGHGTAVAGIVAAKDDSQGVVGIAPNARLWSIKVLDSNGNGLISDIIDGIDYVTQNAHEIDIVNMSFGATGSSTALRNAIINSVAAGITFAAAAGNDGKDASSVIPASYPEVISVSAIVDTDGMCGGNSPITTTAGNDDTLADFSNFGSVVDLAAPGVLIKTTTRGSSYTNSFSGTSASTPHVTGAAALYKSENPGATPSAIRNALRNLGSIPATICDANGHGYFTGDSDNNSEPLLYVSSNSLPLAKDQTVMTGKNTAKIIFFTAGDPDNDPLTYYLVASPLHGTLSGTGQVLMYTPATGYTGSDSFTFRANDGMVNSNTATVSITVVDPASCSTNLPVNFVTASDNDGNNLPSNVLDNNINTRWSNQGVSWIAGDLGSGKNICSVDIAWYLGNQRQYGYAIVISPDGNVWKDTFSGNEQLTVQLSTGTISTSVKSFIPPTNARFVAVIAVGVTNNLVGVTEFDVFASSSTNSPSAYSYSPSLILSGP